MLYKSTQQYNVSDVT